jgi:sigma-B regulation protein RsbU (phosphoserine phosphatase)
MRLFEGDTLFLYTDGVTEALNRQLELFGDTRLESGLREVAEGTSAKELLHSVKLVLDRYTDGAEQADDITMLALILTESGRTE